MSPKQWKILREELVSRGFKVSLKGRSRNEYICELDYMSLDLMKGGVTGTGSCIEMYVFNKDLDLIDQVNCNYYQDILKFVDGYMEDYEMFGDLVS